MLENELELQYLRALKHILIQNSESKYEIIREGYEQKKLSEEDALYFLMTMANRNLRKVLHGGCMGVNPSTGAFGLIYPSCSLMLDFDLSKGFPILTTRKMLTDYIIDFSSLLITVSNIYSLHFLFFYDDLIITLNLN
jgi:hypothetical protein